LVIVPLITGGILQKLLAIFGVRLPRSLTGDKGRNGRNGSRDGVGGGSGLGDSIKGLMTIAKMFL